MCALAWPLFTHQTMAYWTCSSRCEGQSVIMREAGGAAQVVEGWEKGGEVYVTCKAEGPC